MPQRICFLIAGFADGGAQRQCIFLLNELRKDPDLEITLVYFHKGVHDDLLERDGLTVVRVPVKSNYDPRNILKLRRLLKDIRPHILMTWLQNSDVLGLFLRSAVPGMRWLMTERDSDYPLDPRFILRRMLGRHADAIVANSAKGRAYWENAKALGALYVVPNIVHVSGAMSDNVRPSRIVTIGRLEPQKNAGTVVKAFCQLAKRHPLLGFAVIGAGSQEEMLSREVASEGLGERIQFLGFRKDVQRQISESAVVVSMSHHEGLPNVMLESVAGGRLVVASDIPEHKELLGRDYPYLVAERDDPAAVAAMIEVALANAGETSPLDHARKRIAAMTPEGVASTYRSIFDKLAS